ncbi:hypothetical protein F5146DRAFT_1054780 [Armillaria mellea]|nr:hypothetical protein F5146DRAFT_1054780 [Armillaria mellea]
MHLRTCIEGFISDKMVPYMDIYDASSYITWSLIFWDYLITLDDEITLIWFSGRSWIKFLYLANRYIGLILRIWDFAWECLGKTGWLLNHVCGKYLWLLEGDYEACYVGVESNSVLYVSMQLLVIESILIIRVWVIMGKRRWILWTFFGLLVCSTATSIMLNVIVFNGSASLLYAIPTLIFEAIIFISAAYHAIKASGGLRSFLLQSEGPFQYGPKPILRRVFQGSALYFIAVLGSLPDAALGVTIMSVTINHMVLRLRKQGSSNTVGPASQNVELTALRATTNRALCLEEGESVMTIGSFPQGR